MFKANNSAMGGMAAPTTTRTAATPAMRTAPAQGAALTPIQGQSVTYTANGQEVTVSFSDVKQYICPNANDAECKMFLQMCQAYGLDPYMREIMLVKYKDTQPAAPIVSKNAFMKRAELNPQYDGFEAGVVVIGVNNVIDYREGSAVYEGETLVGGWCKVWRKDRNRPCYEEVTLDEYTQTKSDGTPNSMWTGKKATMIRKVAIVHALREAFPVALAGLYVNEEIDADVDGTFREIEPPHPTGRKAVHRTPAVTMEMNAAPAPEAPVPEAEEDPFAAEGGVEP